MIIHQFKTRQPGLYVLLSILSVIVYLTGWRHTEPVASEQAMPLYAWVSAFSSASEKLSFVAGLILFLLQGIQLHLLVNQFEVLYKPSYLPWLMYVTLMGSFPGLLMFSPALPANTFLLLMFDRLFRIYKCDYAQGYHFEAAAMLSIAICFYLPAAGFLLLLIAAMLILHPFDWRNWVSAFLGFLFPVYMLAAVFYLTGRTELLLPRPFQGSFSWNFEWKNVLPAGVTVSALFILVLAVLSILMLRENFFKNTSRTRSYQQVIIIYLTTGLLIMLFTPVLPLHKFVLPAVPLAVLIGYYLLALKKNWVADTFFLMLIALAVLNHLKPAFIP